MYFLRRRSLLAALLALFASSGDANTSCCPHYARSSVVAFAPSPNVAGTRRSRTSVTDHARLAPAPCLSTLSSRERCFELQRTGRTIAATVLFDRNGVDEEVGQEAQAQDEKELNRSRRIGKRVKAMARKLVGTPMQLASAVPMPQAIASILKDASLAAVEEVEEIISRSPTDKKALALQESKEMVTTIVTEAFQPVEESLEEMAASLNKARESLNNAKSQSIEAIEAIQLAAIAQAEGAATAVAQAEKVAEREIIAEIYSDVDVSSLTFEDVDYDSSEMAPPFLDPDSCLVPGEPVVRVEKAPENSRRIFAGIDIMAGVDDVWKILTNYGHLQDVVPNLVVNEVLDMYDGTPLDEVQVDNSADGNTQCKQLAEQMKGSLLKQVGGAKVAGINFSARTTLEVREWPNGMPDFAHFTDDVWMGKSRDSRARDYQKVKLQRYSFPRPFALSSLPTKDISMQSIANDEGEFRLYQGVWRMQPLPGCAPEGKEAMRLSYAVEISPRAYLPVQLVEGRIVKDLCANLEAIRNYVSGDETAKTLE